jgi:hypothetical protein
MSQTIARMYESHERADQAAHELRTNRPVRFSEVFVFARSGGTGAGAGGAEASLDGIVARFQDMAGHQALDGIVARLMACHVLKAHARGYAAGVLRGGALVVVHAPFGCGAEATRILADHGPIDSGVAEPNHSPMAWDDAAPCSSALHVRVLLDDAHTFSRFWNVAPLVKSAATTFSVLGLPEVTSSSGPFTGTFGMPLISKKATFLSSMLGLPVLMNARSSR